MAEIESGPESRVAALLTRFQPHLPSMVSLRETEVSPAVRHLQFRDPEILAHMRSTLLCSLQEGRFAEAVKFVSQTGLPETLLKEPEIQWAVFSFRPTDGN